MSGSHPFLKTYQCNVLTALRGYLEEAERTDAATAFKQITGRQYIQVDALPGLPYVCLRVPTGGGKTLLASHSIEVAADAWLLHDAPVIVWLVPSDPILRQTLSALRDRNSLTRRALSNRFGERVEILDVEAALYAKPAVYAGSAVIIVSTIQAFRQEETAGKRVYAANGELKEHFTTLPADVLSTLESVEGRTVPSLCNVLRAHRPVVIIDEAHGARTKLSFKTLARLSPSLIMEFTATPVLPGRENADQVASNVLYQVSAAELKVEHMVKLPVVLRGRPDPRQNLADAIAWLDHLQGLASTERTKSKPFAPPLMLIQAEPEYADKASLNVNVVERMLIDDFGRTVDEIAVSSGTRDDLAGRDVNALDSKLRFVITQQKLREGWDCPSAYVLCSLTDQRSERVVEQLIGRVIRLPGVEPKSVVDLNQSYVFATSRDFVATAASLRDGLVNNGFEEIEAKLLIATPDMLPGLEPGGHLVRHEEDLPGDIDLEAYAHAVHVATAGRVVIDIVRRRIVATGGFGENERRAVADVLPASAGPALDVLVQRARGAQPAVPQPPLPFTIPRLVSVTDDGEELFDKSQFLTTMWQLDQCSTEPVERRFRPVRANDEAAYLDVTEDGNMVSLTFTRDLRQQMALQLPETGWSKSALIAWLDRHSIGLDRLDIAQGSSVVFINRVVEQVSATRQLNVGELARSKYELKDAIRRGVDELRSKRALQRFQDALISPGIEDLKLATSEESPLVMTEETYSYRQPYAGPVIFQKHAFRIIGDLEATGEEHDCAIHLDRSPKVLRWVRNTSQQPNSFWLQTSSDRFYPDFVAELTDGRYMVLEYKGKPYATNDDSKEKTLIGEVWANLSGNRCLFAMMANRDFGLIDRVAAFSAA